MNYSNSLKLIKSTDKWTLTNASQNLRLLALPPRSRLWRHHSQNWRTYFAKCWYTNEGNLKQLTVVSTTFCIIGAEVEQSIQHIWNGIDCPGFDFWYEKRYFSSPKSPDWLWGPPSLLLQYQFLSQGQNGQVVKLNTHQYPVQKLRSGAISLLHPTPSWRGQGRLFFNLLVSHC